jgi:HTH-type transcriptional regulator/antitoxin HigA
MVLSRDNYVSAIAIPPGKTISDEIKARGRKQVDVAERLGTTEKNLIDLIKWDISLTRDMAIKLEYVFGVSAWSWLNLEQWYQLSLAKIHQEQLALQETAFFKQIKKFLTVPIQLWLLSLTDKTLQESVHELKIFFSRATLLSESVTNQTVCVFRKSVIHDIKPEWVAIFTRTWEILADRQQIWEFQKSTIKQLIQDLKPFMKQETIHHEDIQQICNTYGIYYIYTPYFAWLPVSALSRYYNKNPLIHITDRWNRLDIFWFNLLHELGHIAKWHVTKKESMLDIEKPAEEYKNTPEELEANEFASVTIISKSDYQQLQKKINHTTVMQYAKRLSLHPSLIYGRLCRDGTLTHKEMSNFAVKLHR